MFRQLHRSTIPARIDFWIGDRPIQRKAQEDNRLFYSMVTFAKQNTTDSASPSVRRCGVELTFDDEGTPQSAVARTVISQNHPQVRRETQIAFSIRDGTAQLTGFVKPDQPAVPHLKTVPVACEQVSNIPSIEAVEHPSETLNRIFETGRQLDQGNQD
jgi:hypothetical protein